MNDSNSYRVKLIRGGGYDRFDTARLCISVGQEYHEGEKLKAAFDWAANRFQHVIISVADTLQRHNINATDAHAEALKRGDAWLNRNEDAFKLLKNHEVQRWDMWLNHRDYPTMHQCIKQLYRQHAGFRHDIDITASSFAEKHATASEACRQYLLEETAVFAIQHAETAAVDVYPGTLSIWERFRHQHIEGVPQGLTQRHFTRIGFVRKHA
jgi:tRNA-dependent cyclodipeptide synthase